MSETSKNPDCLLTKEENSNVTLVKKRGRPKGSKNKIKSFESINTSSESVVVIKRGRGRPPGAKNKPKSSCVLAVVCSDTDSLPKRRGRPKGSKNKNTPLREETEAAAKPLKKRGRPRKEPAPTDQTVQQSPSQSIESEIHPLLQAAKWIERKMEHPAQVNYYRRRMASMGASMQAVIAIDILGLFNISDSELRKQIKSTTTEQ
jgi:hypothetical protein